MATRLFLIRHGETEFNARRILQPPDVPLSERGLEQARRLAARLAAEGVERIVSSDLARAAMTARALEAVTGARLVYEPLLQEQNFGDLRGTPYAELREDPFAEGYQPPGGENRELFHRRVERAWSVLRHDLDRVDGTVAVVTHGLVCRQLVARHLEVPPELAEAAAARAWGNTSLTVAEGPSAWRVSLVNCTLHLDGLEADGAAA